MATPNRWAVREAAEVTFFDTVTDNAIVTLKTLKMTEIQTTGETVYARGGRGNAKLVGFSSDREATFSIQDAIFDNKAMAMLTGNEIVTGAKTIHRIKEGKVDTNGTITLGEDVKAIQSVYLLDSDGVTNKTLFTAATASPDAGAEYTFASVTGVLTFHDDDKGKSFRIYYTKDTDATASTIKVTADKFGGTFKMVADVLIRDADSGHDFFGQFIVPRAKIEDDFSFNFSPEGDPSVLDIPLEILKDPASTDMWELVIYDK